MIRRYVLLNGPPRAGKDVAARAITETRIDAVTWGMANHLKEAVHAAYGLPGKPYYAFEDVKDEPRDEFFGLTPRQAYIAFSETYMKVHHGPEVFGHLFLRRTKRIAAPMVLVPDAGFAGEWTPILAQTPKENLLLIHVHRAGHDFSNDSRSYIRLPGVQTVEIGNTDGEQEAYTRAVCRIVSWWADGP